MNLAARPFDPKTGSGFRVYLHSRFACPCLRLSLKVPKRSVKSSQFKNGSGLRQIRTSRITSITAPGFGSEDHLVGLSTSRARNGGQGPCPAVRQTISRAPKRHFQRAAAPAAAEFEPNFQIRHRTETTSLEKIYASPAKGDGPSNPGEASRTIVTRRTSVIKTFLAPVLGHQSELACGSATPCVSSTPRTMW